MTPIKVDKKGVGNGLYNHQSSEIQGHKDWPNRKNRNDH